MQEIIKIHKSKGGKDIVSAKDLYEALGLNMTKWSRWSKGTIEECVDNVENKDWVHIKNISLDIRANENPNHKNPNETKDYAITIQFAKRLAMQTRSPKRREVQDYFLRCEEMAKAVLYPAINISKSELQANTLRPIQLANSKNIATKIFAENRGEIKPIMDYHRANCEQVTGLLPNQIKKKYNVKSGSALEVLRKNEPHLAATCSMNNFLVFEKGATLSDLKQLDIHLNRTYLEFRKLGFVLVD